MVHRCCIKNCDSVWHPESPLLFHRFPLDATQRKNWVAAVKLNTVSYNSAKVCGLHFKPTDYDHTGKELKESAIPFLSKSLDEECEALKNNMDLLMSVDNMLASSFHGNSASIKIVSGARDQISNPNKSVNSLKRSYDDEFATEKSILKEILEDPKRLHNRKWRKMMTNPECVSGGNYSKNVDNMSSSNLGLQSVKPVYTYQWDGLLLCEDNPARLNHDVLPDTPYEGITEKLLFENDKEQLETISERISEHSELVEKEGSISDLDSTSSDIDEIWTEEMQVCRICFSKGSNFMTKKNYLGQIYEIVTGVTIDKGSNMPPYLCVECSHRLMKCNSFRTRSLRAHLILLEVLKNNDNITLELMKSNIENHSIIGSTLKTVHKPVDKYDLEIVHDDKNKGCTMNPTNLYSNSLKSTLNSSVKLKSVARRGVKPKMDMHYRKNDNNESTISDLDVIHLHDDTPMTEVNVKSHFSPVGNLNDDDKDETRKDVSIEKEMKRVSDILNSNQDPLYINFNEDAVVSRIKMEKHTNSFRDKDIPYIISSNDDALNSVREKSIDINQDTRDTLRKKVSSPANDSTHPKEKTEPAIKLKSRCKCENGVFKCGTITEKQREQVCRQFMMSTKKEKRSYVKDTIKYVPIVRKNNANKRITGRTRTFEYYLKIDNKCVRVCKNMYIKTLGVSALSNQ